MRKIVLATLILAFGVNCMAQTEKTEKTGNHLFGARAAYRMYDMAFSYDGYSEYEHTMLKSFSFGIYTRHRIVGDLFLRADLMFNKRGVNLNWDDVKYSLEANYYDLRLPFQYVIAPEGWGIFPYIYAGPSLDFAHSGKITYKSSLTPKETESLNKNNFNSFDLGAVAGIGVDIPINIASLVCNLSLEAGVDIGLRNTFSNKELKGNADVVNPEISNEQNFGTRKNRGFEAAVAFSIPLFDAFRNHKPTPRHEEPTVVIVEKQPVVEQIVEEKPQWVEKECYTLQDVSEMAAAGKDICGIRMCFFDIQFGYNSAKLDSKSLKKLVPVADFLAQHTNVTVTINGHTDSIGSAEYNETLSVKRAKSVADFLISKGIPSSRVNYNGFGLKYPIDTNETAAGRQRNRRVEIEFGCTD